jgi:hypothetical protein
MYKQALNMTLMFICKLTGVMYNEESPLATKQKQQLK